MDPANPYEDDSDADLKLHNYQDGLDTSEEVRDRIIDEETDDPTEGFGVDPAEFKDELDKYDIVEGHNGDDDMREDLEDRDEEMGGDIDDTTQR